VDVHVSLPPDATDLTGSIYRQLRDAVVAGRLRPGERLPATRDLARQLSVARNTVAVAYDRLAGEGLVVGRVGAGTFVSPDVAGTAAGASPGATSTALVPRAVWATVPEQRVTLRDTPRFDFRPGVPDAAAFPHDVWRRLVSSALRDLGPTSASYQEPAGLAELRAAIARWVATSRGVVADPADVVVTAGAQQAVDLAVRVLVEPGAAVAVEDPGYPLVRHLFTTSGMRVVRVPVDDEGMVVDALTPDVRLVYANPSHQFPLGVTMSLRRRVQLLEWAARVGAAIVEDDYDSEFRYAGRPLDPLHTLDRDGRVLYVGSFSKTLLPSLRLGFVVTPPGLARAFAHARMFTDWHSPAPFQLALARFIDDGHLARHVRAGRLRYGARHDLVERLLTERFAGVLSPIPSIAGLHVTAWFAGGAAELRAALASARRAGVVVASLSQYSRDLPRPGVVVGFGAAPVDRITEGLELLLAHLVAAREHGVPPPTRAG
jgi:GntR family transcriptional regulator/MocR family aminotransferase